MKKIVWTYGIIMGVFISVFMLFSFLTMDVANADFGSAELIGILSMVASFSLLFIGVKQVRDKHLGGAISFLMGLKTAGLILLIASSMYSLTWTVYVKASNSTFYVDYYNQQMADIEDPEKLAEKQEEAASTIAQMENPFLLFLYTTFEMIVPGLLFVVIAAAVFRRKTPHENQQ